MKPHPLEVGELEPLLPRCDMSMPHTYTPPGPRTPPFGCPPNCPARREAEALDPSLSLDLRGLPVQDDPLGAVREAAAVSGGYPARWGKTYPEAAHPVFPARPGWDAWALGVARAVAARADCTRRHAGAVILDKQHRLVGGGYNGAPAGKPGCASAGACPRGQADAEQVAHGSSYDTGPGACIAVHAEANALLHADATRYAGGVLAVVSLGPDGQLLAQKEQGPCDGCMRLCHGAGLARVIWPGGERRFG